MNTRIKPQRAHRLDYGEGTFFYSQTRDMWYGRIELGRDENGKRVRAEVTARKEADAWRKLKELRELSKRHKLPSASLTVEAWVKEWLARRDDDVRPNTHKGEKAPINKWILPFYGSRRVKDITGDDIRRIAAVQKKHGNSTTYARSIQQLFQQILSDARADGYLVDDTALLAKKVRAAPNPRQALSVEQATRILDIAGQEPYGSRWVAALLQGMRQGECLGLTWDCVDLEKKIIDVSWQLQEIPYSDKATGELAIPSGYHAQHLYGKYCLVRPKTARGQRLIPLVPWMEAALRRWRGEAPHSPYGLVWCHEDGKPVNSKQDLRAWKQLQDAAGVRRSDGKYFVLHEARNTCATLLLEAGVDPEVIKSILGHSSIVTSRAYMRVNQDMARAALEKVAARLHLEG